MITLIAAMSSNRVIGKNNELPRNIPADMKRFKSLTRDNVVLMGRKTYESIWTLLPHRYNLILSTSMKLKDIPIDQQDTIPFKFLRDMSERRRRYEENKSKHVYIIGGGEIYKEFLPLADDIELTLIDEEVKGDTFFPEFEDQFREESRTTIYNEKEKYKEDIVCHFIHYTRIK